MKSANWKDYLEKLGLLALVASLVFVGLQLRQDKQIAAAQVFVESDAVAIELSQMVSDNNEVWFKGSNGEELSQLDEIKFAALADAVYQRHIGMYRRVQLLGTTSTTVIANTYALYLYEYPGLRQSFMDRSKRIRLQRELRGLTGLSDFHNDILNMLSDLDEKAPPLPERDYIPF